MGLSSWQSNLRSPNGNVISGRNITAPDVNASNQIVATIAIILGLVAAGLLAPELIPLILADAAGEAGAGAAAADVAAGAAAAEEPGYITWAKNVVADPGSYSEDNLNKAEQILYWNKSL